MNVTQETTKKKLPVIDVDAELKKFEDEERARLGLQEEKQWLEDMANLSFTKREKGKITLLIGGLTHSATVRPMWRRDDRIHRRSLACGSHR